MEAPTSATGGSGQDIDFLCPNSTVSISALLPLQLALTWLMWIRTSLGQEVLGRCAALSRLSNGEEKLIFFATPDVKH